MPKAPPSLPEGFGECIKHFHSFSLAVAQPSPSPGQGLPSSLLLTASDHGHLESFSALISNSGQLVFLHAAMGIDCGSHAPLLASEEIGRLPIPTFYELTLTPSLSLHPGSKLTATVGSATINAKEQIQIVLRCRGTIMEKPDWGRTSFMLTVTVLSREDNKAQCHVVASVRLFPLLFKLFPVVSNCHDTETTVCLDFEHLFHTG